MIHRIVLGDWSGDGHSISQEILIDIPDEFDREIIKNNYEANVLELGVDPSQIAGGYQDNSVPAEVAKTLFDAGLDKDAIEEYNGEYGVDEDRYIELLMFFVGRGLTGFSYEIVTDQYPTLFGGYGAINREHYGYGLYGY